MDNVLRLLGIAKKAGRLEIGEEPVGAAARARQARVILLASDAASNTARRAGHFGEAGNVLWLATPYTKAQLGSTVGRSSCAMLAITDAGLASSLVKKLAAADPEKYASASQQLEQKADKVLRRQREQRQHEKNLKLGKLRPWAAPQKKENAPKTGNAAAATRRTGAKAAAPIHKKKHRKGPGEGTNA